MAEKSTQEMDWGLVGIYIALMAIGLFNLLSATSPAGQGGGIAGLLADPPRNFVQQMWFMGFGLVLMILFSRLDYRLFERMAYPIYLLSLAALVAVLFVGKKASGSTSWIEIGGFRIQPSEPGKLALIFVLAKHLQTDRFLRPYGLKELVVPALYILIPLVLLYFEPDLGTALFYALVGSSMVFFYGVRWRPIAISVVVSIPLAIFAYRFLLHPHQQARIFSFLNPQSDPLGSGYHVIQSLIAVGSGKFWGKGFLAGSQSQLKFLPEQHTDFIFSVLAEERGFVGGFLLLALYLGLLLKGINVAAKARDRFGAWMGVGLVSLFFWQITVNLGGVLGLLPLTGIPLPFLSYGGSSIITLSIAVGMLQSVRRRRFMF